MKEVIIYTDGACSGNPGPGGWGALLIYKGKEKELSGYESDTTNNRMEMMAIINALSALKEPCKVLLHSDSNYIINAFNQGWINKWKINGWKTLGRKEVANQDLWDELVKLNHIHDIEWIKVKGHSKDKLNDRVDKLAVSEIKNAKAG
jgi:ribonuclease HI